MKTVPIRYGLLFPPRASHPFTYEQRPTRTWSRSAADSFPNILPGPGLARAGLTCFSVSWLQTCTRSHADLRGWASWREGAVALRYSSVPTGFPSSRISSRNLSASTPGGSARSGLLASHRKDGGFGACVRAGQDWILEICLGPTVQQKTSLALQACCCSGNRKPSISSAITSWLSLLLHQGGDFINLEKPENTEIDFFFFYKASS